MAKKMLIAGVVLVLAIGAFFFFKNSHSPGPMQVGDQGLGTQDLKIGTGDEAVPGKMVTVHYVGTLTNGREFDSSIKRGQPFKFPLGASRVIKGWDLGVVGMRVGGKRKLTIPAPLAYGEKGAGDVIPPGATLVFEVELLGVE